MADFLDQGIYVLDVIIHKGTDIDNNSDKKLWVYRGIITDGNGKEFCRELRCGPLNPVFNHSLTELCIYPPRFLYLDIIEENCFSDPGPSTGSVVRGRAQVEVPKILGFKETRKVELVRNDGFKRTFGGFVYLTIAMRKLQLWKVLENAGAIGLRVPKLTEFLLANAGDLGFSCAKLSRILFTNAAGLNLVNLADHVFANAEFLSLSAPNSRKRRNQEARAGFSNGQHW